MNITEYIQYIVCGCVWFTSVLCSANLGCSFRLTVCLFIANTQIPAGCSSPPVPGRKTGAAQKSHGPTARSSLMILTALTENTFSASSKVRPNFGGGIEKESALVSFPLKMENCERQGDNLAQQFCAGYKYIFKKPPQKLNKEKMTSGDKKEK